MGLFKKLVDLFSTSSPGHESALYPIAVQCHRCSEIIHASINLSNDLSEDFDEAGDATTYHVRKVLMGSGRCFQQIEVALRFDAGRKLIEQEIVGGKFVRE